MLSEAMLLPIVYGILRSHYSRRTSTHRSSYASRKRTPKRGRTGTSYGHGRAACTRPCAEVRHSVSRIALKPEPRCALPCALHVSGQHTKVQGAREPGRVHAHAYGLARCPRIFEHGDPVQVGAEPRVTCFASFVWTDGRNLQRSASGSDLAITRAIDERP